jgi:predicted nucleotidyltransferase
LVFLYYERSVSNKVELFQRMLGNGQQIRSFGIEKISVFGSFARDSKIRKSSDIDFLLDFRKGEKNFDNLVDLGEYLENLLGRKVELLTRESLKSEIGKHIIATSEEINF